MCLLLVLKAVGHVRRLRSLLKWQLPKLWSFFDYAHYCCCWRRCYFGMAVATAVEVISFFSMLLSMKRSLRVRQYL